jgi:hypothetical protein
MSRLFCEDEGLAFIPCTFSAEKLRARARKRLRFVLNRSERVKLRHYSEGCVRSEATRTLVLLINFFVGPTFSPVLKKVLDRKAIRSYKCAVAFTMFESEKKEDDRFNVKDPDK